MPELRRDRVRPRIAVHDRAERGRSTCRTSPTTTRWLTEIREGLGDPGQYLAYRSPGGDVVAFALHREWTRIGRSLAADIRFDDPTVSRRHALIVRQPDGLRVLDDRSLNGVFVNGERVEWSTLADADEIVIGRHHLHYVDVPVISGMRHQHSQPASSS